MSAFQLVLVEDDMDRVKEYRGVLDDYSEEHDRRIDMRVVNTLDEAEGGLDRWVDAAIVDLNLGNDTSDGGKIIDKLKDSFRVPVAVLTGTPADAEDTPPVVGIFTKGQHRFDEVLDRLWSIHEIGLTKIMGGRGLLEERLNQVFLRNLLPTLDAWLEYGRQNRGRTEKALLRYALGHLMASLEGDETPCYPEEVYLAPPLDDSLTTGSLVRCKKRQTCHVVMTPACDLIVRDGGKPKTSMVVIAEVVGEALLFEELGANQGRKRKLRHNNDAGSFHWLPECQSQEGGFVDFRRLETVVWKEFDQRFNRMQTRVAPGFVKDIVSRFSTFYARQGQPVIDFQGG